MCVHVPALHPSDIPLHLRRLAGMMRRKQQPSKASRLTLSRHGQHMHSAMSLKKTGMLKKVSSFLHQLENNGINLALEIILPGIFVSIILVSVHIMTNLMNNRQFINISIYWNCAYVKIEFLLATFNQYFLLNVKSTQFVNFSIFQPIKILCLYSLCWIVITG